MLAEGTTPLEIMVPVVRVEAQAAEEVQAVRELPVVREQAA